MGYLQKGDRVGDAFGGIGTGGIVAAYRGLEWVGVELENKFCLLSLDNFELHAAKWCSCENSNREVRAMWQELREKLCRDKSQTTTKDRTVLREGMQELFSLQREADKRGTPPEAVGSGALEQRRAMVRPDETETFSISDERVKINGEKRELERGTINKVRRLRGNKDKREREIGTQAFNGIALGEAITKGGNCASHKSGENGQPIGELDADNSGQSHAASQPTRSAVENENQNLRQVRDGISERSASGESLLQAMQEGSDVGTLGKLPEEPCSAKSGSHMQHLRYNIPISQSKIKDKDLLDALPPDLQQELQSGPTCSKCGKLRVPFPRIIQGDSRRFAENVAGVVTSPPYADSIDRPSGIDPTKVKKPGGPNGNTHMDIYGEASGQIGSLKSGQVDSVISSPPFSAPNMQPCIGQGVRKDLVAVGKCPETNGKAHRTDGNIETLKEGTVQAVVSSPPYSDIAAGAGGLNTKPAKKPGQQSGRKAESASQDTDQRYGTSTGQISQLKGGSVDGVVSSPPYESGLGNGGGAAQYKLYVEKGLISQATDQYGDSEGQIGKENGETYWEAVLEVYRSCFKCIKPGGYLILVLKDYCKAGKRVRLCDDTMRLLEHIGFQPLERIHAMLVTETVENGLFGDEKTKRQRKSFFRRLYEAKLPENDERRIDFEEVLICRRP